MCEEGGGPLTRALPDGDESRESNGRNVALVKYNSGIFPRCRKIHPIKGLFDFSDVKNISHLCVCVCVILNLCNGKEKEADIGIFYI